MATPEEIHAKYGTDPNWRAGGAQPAAAPAAPMTPMQSAYGEEHANKYNAGQLGIHEKYGTDPDWRNAIRAPEEQRDYDTGIGYAFMRGFERLRAMPDVAQGDYDELADHYGNMDKWRMSDEDVAIFEDMREQEGWWNKAGSLMMNPRLVLQVVSESLPMMAAPIVGAIGGGLAGGAMTANPIGAAGGAMIGGGIGSYFTEYYASMGEYFGEQGVDMTNAQQLKMAFADAELMAGARQFANARGIPIAVFDALSMGLAGRVAAPARGVAKAVTGRTLGAGVVSEIGMQAGLGAAGEAGAQISSLGHIEDELDVLLEGVAEIVPGAAEATVMSYVDRKAKARQAGIEDPNTSPLAALDTPDPTDIDNATGEVVSIDGNYTADELDLAFESSLADLEEAGQRETEMQKMEDQRAKQKRDEIERMYADETDRIVTEATSAALESEMVTPEGIPVEGEPVDVAGGIESDQGQILPAGVNPVGGRPLTTSLGEALRGAGVEPPVGAGPTPGAGLPTPSGSQAAKYDAYSAYEAYADFNGHENPADFAVQEIQKAQDEANATGAPVYVTGHDTGGINRSGQPLTPEQTAEGWQTVGRVDPETPAAGPDARPGEAALAADLEAGVDVEALEGQLESEEERAAIQAADRPAEPEPTYDEIPYESIKGKPVPAVEWADERLTETAAHEGLDRMTTEIVPGGGITLVESDEIGVTYSHRTKSENPPWVQAIIAEEGVGRKEIFNAVEKAKAGKRLGVRQKRIIESMLDEWEAPQKFDSPEEAAMGENRPKEPAAPEFELEQEQDGVIAPEPVAPEQPRQQVDADIGVPGDMFSPGANAQVDLVDESRKATKKAKGIPPNLKLREKKPSELNALADETEALIVKFGKEGETKGGMDRTEILLGIKELQLNSHLRADELMEMFEGRDKLAGMSPKERATQESYYRAEELHEEWRKKIETQDPDPAEVAEVEATINTMAAAGDPDAFQLAVDQDWWTNWGENETTREEQGAGRKPIQMRVKSNHERFKKSRKANKWGNVAGLTHVSAQGVSVDISQLSWTVPYDTLTFESPKDQARLDRMIEIYNLTHDTPVAGYERFADVAPPVTQPSGLRSATEDQIREKSAAQLAKLDKTSLQAYAIRLGIDENGSKIDIARRIKETVGEAAAPTPTPTAPPPAAPAGTGSTIDETKFNEVGPDTEQRVFSSTVDKKNRKAIDTKLKKTKFLTPADADALVTEWEDHAIAQRNERGGPQAHKDNFNRVILSLFDTTGTWANPYALAGYDVRVIDIKNGVDVQDFSAQYLEELFDSFGGKEVYGVIAACPCTTFSNSSTKWRRSDLPADHPQNRHENQDPEWSRKWIEDMWGTKAAEAKNEDGTWMYATPHEYAIELVAQTMRTLEYYRPQFWALENPEGRIETAVGLPNWRTGFQPSNFGEPYTKRTLLWGEFNEDLPTANVDPVEGSKMHKMSPSEDRAAARAETPVGFSYAFFMANNYLDADPVERTKADYWHVAGAVEEAMRLGVTEDQIRENIYLDRAYEPEGVEETRQAIRDLIDDVTGGKPPPTGGLPVAPGTPPAPPPRGAPMTDAEIATEQDLENWPDDPVNPKVIGLVDSLNRENIVTTMSGDLYADDLVYVDLGQSVDSDTKLPEGWKVTALDAAITNADILGTEVHYANGDPMPADVVESRRRDFYGGRRRIARAGNEPVSQSDINAITKALAGTAIPLSEAEIDAAANEADPDAATDAQKEAGNYKKGHLTIAGLDFTIENPAGTVRHGNLKLRDHYGYIKRTEGADGDQVDVFINSKAKEDWNGDIYIVDQIFPEVGGFDEHKVMFGYNNLIDARRAYRRNFNKDWKGQGAVTKMSLNEFNKWLAEPGANKKPASMSAVTEAGKAERQAHGKKLKYSVSKDQFNAPSLEWTDKVLNPMAEGKYAEGMFPVVGDKVDTGPMNKAVTELLKAEAFRLRQAAKPAPAANQSMEGLPAIEEVVELADMQNTGRVGRIVNEFNKEFPKANIKLVNRNDPEVRANLEEQIKMDLGEMVGNLTTPAMYDPQTETIYIFKDRLMGGAAAALGMTVKRLVLHEMTHRGLHVMFEHHKDGTVGELSYQKLMEDIYNRVPAKHKALLKKLEIEYGLDTKKYSDDMWLAAEELVANLAEKEGSDSLVARVVEFVRKFLEKIGAIGPADAWSDQEIRDLIAEAHGGLRRNADVRNRMSLRDATITEEVTLDETGEVFEVERAANDVISDVDKRISICKKLRACL